VTASSGLQSQPQIQKILQLDFTYYFGVWFLVFSEIFLNFSTRPTFKLVCALASSGAKAGPPATVTPLQNS